MFNPGDIVCLTDEAISYYTDSYNKWWTYWWGKDAIPSECLIKITKIERGMLYGEPLNAIKYWENETSVAPVEYFKLYISLSKEEKILKKISYLYSKCKTTKQWATS